MVPVIGCAWAKEFLEPSCERAHGHGCDLAMSLVRASSGLSISISSSSKINSCGVPSEGILKQYRGWWLARSRIALPERVVVRAGGYEEFAVASGNQVAPPVGNVFGVGEKEVNALKDPVGFVKGGLERNAQSVRHALESVGDAVAPSPYSPSQGTGAVFFVCLSGFLFLAFWLGNYYLPTWIFKDTVFRNSEGNLELEDERDKRGEEEKEEVDPADLIELPTNLMPFRDAAVAGFKAGRQKARDSAEKWTTKKKSEKHTK